MARLRSISDHWRVFVTLSILAGGVLCGLQAALEMATPMSIRWLDDDPTKWGMRVEVIRLEKWLLSETLTTDFASSEVDYYLHTTMLDVEIKRAVGWPVAWLWVEHHREVVLLMSRKEEVFGRTESEITLGSRRIAEVSVQRLLVFLSFWVGCGLVLAGIMPFQRRMRMAIRTRRGLCGHCGYRRRGWVSAVCPECGETLSD